MYPLKILEMKNPPQKVESTVYSLTERDQVYVFHKCDYSAKDLVPISVAFLSTQVGM